MADSKDKWLWIVTGPNGAGKSTLWNSQGDESLKQLPYINLDEKAKEAILAARPEDKDLSPEEFYLKADKENEKKAEEFRKDGQSYAIEKAAPGRRTFALVKKLKAEGWKIGVMAVGIKAPELASERMEGRVKEGGHAENMASSFLYRACLANTPQLIAMSDKAVLYDNSGEGFREIARRDAPGERMTMTTPEADFHFSNSYMRQMIAGLRKKDLMPEVPGTKR